MVKEETDKWGEFKLDLCKYESKMWNFAGVGRTLLYAAVWLLLLLTSVLGIQSWTNSFGVENNCRKVYSLMMSSCVICSNFQMITQTPLPQCSKDLPCQQSVTLGTGYGNTWVLLQMFPYFLTLLCIHTYAVLTDTQLFYPIRCWKLQYKNSYVGLIKTFWKPSRIVCNPPSNTLDTIRASHPE